MGKACYGLLENGIRVKKGDEMQKFPIQAVLADDIIGVEGGKNLEQLSQARKKDHVFEITNTAIERVPVVETPLFSDLQNNFLASLHREVLRIAKLENAGKEVALVTTISFGRPIKVLGDEHSVNIEQSSQVNALKMNAYMGELVVAHNHPTTRNFSFSDIGVFVIDEYIATLSVVTNQGQVYVMQKSDDFHYDEARQLINALVDQYELLDYPEDEARQEAAAKEFLKKTRKVGIWYGTSK